MITKKKIYSSAVTALFFTGGAYAAGDYDSKESSSKEIDIEIPQFSEVDQDQNGTISESEVRANENLSNALNKTKKTFQELDEDQNQLLDEKEFASFRETAKNEMARNRHDPNENQQAAASDNSESEQTVSASGERTTDSQADVTSPPVTEDPTNTLVGASDERQDDGVSPDVLGLTADQIGGMEVINQQGQEIGTIKTLTRLKSTGELLAVIESGGFLGIGDTDFPVSLSEFRVEGDNLRWERSLTKDEIEDTYSDYDESLYVAIEETGRTIGELLTQ